MEKLDQILESHIRNEKQPLHNAAFLAFDKNGNILYSAARGSKDVAGTQPITIDSVFWIASLTKLSTAVATMLAVEKGLVTLDEDVRKIVPELADIDILDGIANDGTPQLRPCTSPITLRQLLSHTSGFCYDLHHPHLKAWSAHVSRTANTFSGSYAGYLHPLIFAPGTGWAYGPGMDWAGRVIEVVTKTSLEAFMRTHIWEPLRMSSTSFDACTLEQPVELAWRNAGGEVVLGKVPLANPATDCCGGVGLYSTATNQAKLLAALLRGELLEKGSWREVLMPQLGASDSGMQRGFTSVVCGERKGHLGATWPDGARGSFGLSSSVNAEAFPGRREKGSANWQGMPGVHAWIDPTTGVGGVFLSQVLPPGDPAATKCFIELETAFYAAIKGQ